MANQEEEKSITWVIVMLMLTIAAFGWAFAAAGYAHAVEGWGSGTRGALGAFIRNAINQIPNLPAVIGFAVSKRFWLVIVLIVLEVIVLLGGLKLRALEKQDAGPPRRRRR